MLQPGLVVDLGLGLAAVAAAAVLEGVLLLVPERHFGARFAAGRGVDDAAAAAAARA